MNVRQQVELVAGPAGPSPVRRDPRVLGALCRIRIDVVGDTLAGHHLLDSR